MGTNQFSVTLDVDRWNRIQEITKEEERRYRGEVARRLLSQRVDLELHGWRFGDKRMFDRLKAISSLDDKELKEIDEVLVRLYAKYKRADLVPAGLIGISLGIVTRP